ncbi:MAG: asparagine synthase [Emcibacteraceae bacterium]|nr:asparagine synthase [Emcibacteraceae bacterium]
MKKPIFGIASVDISDQNASLAIDILYKYCDNQNIDHPTNIHSTKKIILSAPNISGDAKNKYGYSGYLPTVNLNSNKNNGSVLNEFMDRLDLQGSTLDTPLLAGSLAAVKHFGSDDHLMLLVDRCGINSIYYSVFDDFFCFSDRLDLVLMMAKERKVRREGVIEWCHLGIPLPPFTLFENINVLSASKTLDVNLRNFEIKSSRYFDAASMVDKNLHEKLKSKSVLEIENEIETRLDIAVQESLAGANEASILLSGGVDSSTIAAICSRHAKVYAVTVDVEGDSEVEYARRAADHLNIELSICKFGKSEFTNYFVDGVYNLGTPPIVENGIALQYLAAQGYLKKDRLVLDGEGADALFYGSTPLFKFSMVAYLLSEYFPFGGAIAGKVIPSIRNKLNWLGMSQRTAMDRYGLDIMLGARMMEFDELSDRLMKTLAHVDNKYAREVSMLALRELYDYLLPLMLRINAMSTVADTSVILPFMNEKFFHFAQNIPIKHKIRLGLNGRPAPKWILKRLAAKLLPSEIIYRPKCGFGIPGGAWIGDMPEKWIKDSWVQENFNLSSEAFSGWLKRSAGQRDMMYLMGIEVWGRLFDRNDPLETVRNQFLEDKDYSD